MYDDLLNRETEFFLFSPRHIPAFHTSLLSSDKQVRKEY